MESFNKRGSELWRRWQQTAVRRPRISLLVDAPTGRAFRAAEIMSAAETVFRLGDFKSTTGCVAWVLPNGLDWLAIFLATQKANWAALPLDPGFNERQGRELAAQLGATHWWNGQTLSSLGPPTRRWRGVAVVKVTSGSTGQAIFRAACCNPFPKDPDPAVTPGAAATPRDEAASLPTPPLLAVSVASFSSVVAGIG